MGNYDLDRLMAGRVVSDYAGSCCLVVNSSKKAVMAVRQMVAERGYSGRNVIAVDGKPCVGKSSFCRELGAKIGAAVVHGDNFYGADDCAVIDVAAFLKNFKKGLIVFDETYSASKYAFDPLMRIYVRVSSEALRLDAVRKRSRLGDAVLFDRKVNADFDAEFQSPEQKFDLIFDNTRTIESFVLNN